MAELERLTLRVEADLAPLTRALAGASESAVLNGANPLLIGDEIVQFAQADLQADGSHLLSVLLRGRRGTEWAITAHRARERVVVLEAETLLRLGLPDSDLGIERFWKAVTVGGRLAEAAVVSLTLAGRSLMPYAPVHLRAQKEGNGDWTISWVRRTRIGGAWKDGIDVPLGEESESYLVEILEGGAAPDPAVVASFQVGSPGATYTLAQQVADFGAGQTTLRLRVRQVSAAVGPGFAAEGTFAAA